ncbi:GNAT family N-acetyltransferase [Bacteroides fragilis]|nr:GNAT family N-acetyltransferase [Bacteroides fragilis]
MHTTILETERLLLRPFRETDLQELFECCQNPNLGNNAGWEPHKSIEDSKEVLHTVFMGNEGVFAIILKEDNSLVGSIGIITDPKRGKYPDTYAGILAERVPLGKRYGLGSDTNHIGLWI